LKMSLAGTTISFGVAGKAAVAFGIKLSAAIWPITAVVAALVVFGAIIYAVIRNWEEITYTITQSAWWNSIKTGIEDIKGWFAGLFNFVPESWGKMLGIMGEKLKEWSQTAKKWWDKFTGADKMGWAASMRSIFGGKGEAGGGVSGVKNPIEKAMDGLSNATNKNTAATLKLVDSTISSTLSAEQRIALARHQMGGDSLAPEGAVRTHRTMQTNNLGGNKTENNMNIDAHITVEGEKHSVQEESCHYPPQAVPLLSHPVPQPQPLLPY